MRHNQPIAGCLSGQAVSVALLGLLLGVGWLAPVSAQLEDRSCLGTCHGQSGHQATIEGKTAAYVDVGTLRASIHKDLVCLDCHQDVTQIPHADEMEPVRCVSCHYKGNPRGAPGGEEYSEYVESIHFRMNIGDQKKPTCTDCHGTHGILPPSNPASSVAKREVANTCGRCHETVYEDYIISVHGRELMGETEDNAGQDVPGCVDCHGVHRIFSPKDPRSPVYSTHVSQTCSTCHGVVEVVGKYGLSVKRVQSFAESYHGLANKYGVRTVANCASCHGVHRILPSSDPASSIHTANLQNTCAQEGCHANAVKDFANRPIHLGVVTDYRLTRWIEIAYIVFIVLVLGSMVVHNIFDHLALRRRGTHVSDD